MPKRALLKYVSISDCVGTEVLVPTLFLSMNARKPSMLVEASGAISGAKRSVSLWVRWLWRGGSSP